MAANSYENIMRALLIGVVHKDVTKNAAFPLFLDCLKNDITSQKAEDLYIHVRSLMLNIPEELPFSESDESHHRNPSRIELEALTKDLLEKYKHFEDLAQRDEFIKVLIMEALQQDTKIDKQQIGDEITSIHQGLTKSLQDFMDTTQKVRQLIPLLTSKAVDSAFSMPETVAFESNDEMISPS